MGARVRRACLVLGVIAAAALMGAANSAAGPAEDYVQTNIAAGLSILQDKDLTHAARLSRIHDFLLSLLDAGRIARYALGPAAATAKPADIAAYDAAFREFIAADYESQLDDYDGQTLKVTGAVEHAPGDFVVTTQLHDPSAPADGSPPLEIDIRVLDENGAFHVVDASIEGVWLALAMHDDFQGFLKQHNDDVPALTAHLKDMAAQFLAPDAAH